MQSKPLPKINASRPVWRVLQLSLVCKPASPLVRLLRPHSLPIHSTHRRHRSAKTARRPIQNRQDFADLKESDILKICRAARLISGETLKSLDEKLGKRNTAAHPSTVIVGTATAEEVIFDLVENILLKTAL